MSSELTNTQKDFFVTKVRKQGGAAITTISKKLLDEAGLKEGDEVKMHTEGNTVVIEKSDNRMDRVQRLHEYSRLRFGKLYKDLAK